MNKGVEGHGLVIILHLLADLVAEGDSLVAVSGHLARASVSVHYRAHISKHAENERLAHSACWWWGNEGKHSTPSAQIVTNLLCQRGRHEYHRVVDMKRTR